MASGVATHPQCVAEFMKMKQSKKMTYIIFKLNDTLTEVLVDEIGYKGEKTFEDFRISMAAAIKVGQGRYAVVDTQDHKHKDVLVFVNCLDDDCSVLKQKMVYTSSKLSFKKSLDMGMKDWQVNCINELTTAELAKVVEKGATK